MEFSTVKNNVDICLFSSNIDDYDLKTLVRHDERALMFGELKGGIDPAGADEHWKTGNTALNKIRTSFAEQFGFTPVKVYCLKQQKGNSSQQMKKYGRVALRKSVTIWKKD